MRNNTIFLVSLLVLAIVIAAGLGYGYYQTATSLAAREAELRDVTNERDELAQTLNNTKDRLTTTISAYREIQSELEEEQERKEEIEEELEDLARTVGVLDKLAKTDEELLMKYSKTYFLNEHYRPTSLDAIPREFIINDDGIDKYFLEPALPYLEEMLEDAEDDDIDLRVVSAYRPSYEQRQLKETYTVQYGSGANTFSADQGYSEHQLATAVDFSTPELSGMLDGFDKTAAYLWLQKNAHKYGFILSYPEGNDYYVFEPWHWRFVGEDLARDLYEDDMTFAEMDQREINEYLVDLF